MKAIKFAYFKIKEMFVATVAKFFQPLRVKKQLLPLLLWPAVLILAGWMHIGTGIPELVRQNCRGARALAAEMVNESGPEFIVARKRFAAMLERYVEHMERRHLSFVLDGFYPQHSPAKQLRPLVSALKKAEDDEEKARKIIFQVGETIGQFCEDAEDFGDREVVWFKHERLPKSLAEDLENALEESHKLTDGFEEEMEKALSDGVLNELERSQLTETARAVCEANRRTILLLFLTRMGFDKPEEIVAFGKDVKRASVYTRRLAGKMEGDLRHASLLDWAESEDRRAGILEMMSTGNDEKVCDLLKKAIERASKREKGNFVEQVD